MNAKEFYKKNNKFESSVVSSYEKEITDLMEAYHQHKIKDKTPSEMTPEQMKEWTHS